MDSIQPVLPLGSIKKPMKVVQKNEDSERRQQSKQQSRKSPVGPTDDQQIRHIDETV